LHKHKGYFYKGQCRKYKENQLPLFYCRNIDKKKVTKEKVAKKKEKSAQEVNQVEEAFRQAISLYKQKHFIIAREKFLEVNQMSPGYKSTKRYIKKLDKKIAKQERYLSKGKELKDVLRQERKEKEKEIAKLKKGDRKKDKEILAELKKR